MSRVETFLNVTLPPLRFTLFVFTCITTVLSMKLFDFIFVLSGGGPGTASATLTYRIYKESFKDLDLGYGAAMSFMLLALIPGHDTASLRRLGATGGEVDMRIRLSTIWSWLALAIVLIWTLLPLYWFLKNSLLTPDEIARFPPPLYPLDPTPAAFFNIFGFEYEMANGIVRRGSGQANQIIRGLGNSLIVSAVVTLVTLFVVLPLAYVFARLEFPHKNKLLFAILLAVALPPVSTLIPFYAMYVRLGLSGTLIGLIIVTLTITIPS